MPVPFDFVEIAMDLIHRPAMPKTCIAPAEFFIGDPARGPLVEIIAGTVFPDTETLVYIAPRTWCAGEGAVDVEDDGGDHFWGRTRFKNSFRVFWLSLKAPNIELVTATEFCFSTPRMIMQRCCASITTATPRGWILALIVSAIWVVNRS